MVYLFRDHKAMLVVILPTPIQGSHTVHLTGFYRGDFQILYLVPDFSLPRTSKLGL